MRIFLRKHEGHEVDLTQRARSDDAVVPKSFVLLVVSTTKMNKFVELRKQENRNLHKVLDGRTDSTALNTVHVGSSNHPREERILREALEALTNHVSISGGNGFGFIPTLPPRGL